MQGSFRIRAAQGGDRPTLVQFMVLLQDAERSLHPNRRPGAEMGDRHLAYLEHQVQEHDGQIFVAEAEGTVVGFVVCFLERLDADDLHLIEAERTYGYVSDLYVTPTQRNQGIASALMHAAEQHFQQAGVATVRVGLLANNGAAARFYEQAGYRPYEVVYEKPLAAAPLAPNSAEP